MFEQKTIRTYFKFCLFVFLLLPLLIIGIVGFIRFCGSHNQRERVATLLAVNDIYRVAGVGENELGGLHRLRTLRKIAERTSPETLLLHAGDFLSPSLEGRVFKGEQMIDAMNSLDGDAKKFDARMFVTFGNHEFDDSQCGQPAAPLNKRVEESQFTWLVANLDFSNCASMKEMMAHENVKRTAVANINGIKVGIFGIGLTDPKDPRKYPKYINEIDTARAAIKELRAEHADVIVALTHLSRKEDEALIRALVPEGLDLLVGGHDHDQMVIKDGENRIRGFKADSDARTAWQIDIRVRNKGGRPEIEGRIVTLNEAIARDANIAELAETWSSRAEAKLCAERAARSRSPSDDRCLRSSVGMTQFQIRLEESANRGEETVFGRWLAKVALDKTKADIAIINAGILGLNTNLEAGSPLRLRHIVDMIRFDDIVAVAEFPQRDVCGAIRGGFGRPGSGAWPHVYGASAEGPSSKPEEIQARWAGPIKLIGGSELNCNSDAKIKVAGVPFLLCGGDGYPFMANDDGANPGEDHSAKAARCVGVLQKKANDTGLTDKLGDLAEDAIRGAGPAGISPPPPVR